MNAFYEHHKSSVEFGYRCFDRLLLNGLIQPRFNPSNNPNGYWDSSTAIEMGNG